MSVFKPNSYHLREVSIFCFHLKKSAAAAHWMFSSTCVEDSLSERTCREWFQRFKNGDFDVEDRHTVGPNACFSFKKVYSLQFYPDLRFIYFYLSCTKFQRAHGHEFLNFHLFIYYLFTQSMRKSIFFT